MCRALSVRKYLFNVVVFSSILGVDAEVVSAIALAVAPQRPPRLLEPVGTPELDPHMPRTTAFTGGKGGPRPPPEDEDTGDRPWRLLHRYCEPRVSRGYDCRCGHGREEAHAAADACILHAGAKEALIACHSGPPFALGVEVECRHAHPGSTDAAQARKGICRIGEDVVVVAVGLWMCGRRRRCSRPSTPRGSRSGRGEEKLELGGGEEERDLGAWEEELDMGGGGRRRYGWCGGREDESGTWS
jgi:hypothetical protein